MNKAHGSPLGDEEIAATRKAIGWDYPPFVIPEDVYEAWDARKKGNQLESAWNDLFAKYSEKYPAEARELMRRISGELPSGFEETVRGYIADCVARKENIATRKASQNAIEALAPGLPEFLGGSADLTGSNLTNWKESVAIRGGQTGNYINYGVREFGMVRHYEWYCSSWRIHSVWRYIPDIFGLLPQCDQNVGTDADRNDLRVHA